MKGYTTSHCNKGKVENAVNDETGKIPNEGRPTTRRAKSAGMCFRFPVFNQIFQE